jgi:hypothetical protein
MLLIGMREKRTGFGIALEAQHDFRGTIPSCGDIFRHVSSILFGIHGKATRQPKVADLQLTVRIDKQIAGLQISVEDIGRVDVLQATKNLVDEGLEMGIRQRLPRTDDCRQITFHKFYKPFSQESPAANHANHIPS